MKKAQLLELFDRELRIDISIPGVKKETFPDLVRMTREPPGMNYVLYSKLGETRIDEAIDEQIAHFSRFEQPFSWHVYQHDQPSCLGDILVKHGFERDDDPDAILLFPLKADIRMPAVPDGVEIRRLEAPEQLEDVRLVEERVLGGDFEWLVKRLKPHLQIPEYLSVFVAYENNKPVSTGWIYFHFGSQFASLFGGATVDEQRGRGIYRALVAQRLQNARQRGRRFVTTGASPYSRPILSKMGFDLLTIQTDYVWKG